MPNQASQVILKGGEDLISSGIEISPGRAQLLYNYYCDPKGGYTKVPGYVAFDGRPITLDYDDGDGPHPAVGDVITAGGVSATIMTLSVTSGTWAAGTATGVITVSGHYGGAADLMVGDGTFEAASSSTCNISGQSVPGAVPGSGAIKGVWIWNDSVWAIRSNGAAPPAHDVLYKSSASGWVAAAIGYRVAFTAGGGGAAAPIPIRGDTLTKGGVTATISGVAITSGNFESDGTAAGYLYVHTVAGGHFSAGAATYAGKAITLGGAEVASELGDGLKAEFRNENFSSTADTPLMYFVNGADPCWEYDGSALVAIRSGGTPDTPNHLETHGQRLFLSLPGGSIFYSSPGSPTTGFTQDYTAGAVSVGTECTGMQSLVGGALAIFGKSKTKLLTGNISGPDGDMSLTDHSRNIGAIEWSIQNALDVYFVSDLGVTSLYQTDKYGNFAGAGLSTDIDPLVKVNQRYLVDSVFIQRKGLYRIFYSNGQFITAGFTAGRMIGWGRGGYDFTVNCVNSGEIGADERVFAGSDDGWVYELEVGRNCNGGDMRCGVILPYNALGNVMVDKQWRKTIFQLDAVEAFDFSYAVEFNYSESGWPGGSERTDQTKGGGAFWGVGVWNTFVWSGTSTYGTTELDTFGVGFNMAIVITVNDDNTPDHTLRAYSSIYEGRRLVH